MIDQDALFETVQMAHENAAALAQMAHRQAQLTEQLAAARRRAEIAEVIAIVPLVVGAIRAAIIASKRKPDATATTTAAPTPTPKPVPVAMPDDLRAAWLAAFARAGATVQPKGA